MLDYCLAPGVYLPETIPWVDFFTRLSLEEFKKLKTVPIAFQMKNNRSRKSESIHIKDVLSAIIRDCRKETNTELLEIRKFWNSILDTAVTDNAQPTALKGSTLLVTVKSSRLTHQLRFRTQDIIGAINRMSGRRRISKIKIKTRTF